MEGRENWVNAEISRELKQNYYDGKASLIRIEESESFPPADTKQAFQTWASVHGCTADKLYAIVLKGTEVKGYRFREENDCVPLTVLMPQPAAQRLDETHGALAGKTVGLIGCGSLGSKIGASLCRSGVTQFKLIDDDILFPENLVRNELDWRDIGAHKASALAGRLSLINASVKATVMKQKLGGQESSGSIEAVIGSFQGCDLLIDATANPSVFNLLAALPDKPLVWGEVFGGGFGGLIARYRPGIEPDPLMMRRAIENWFAERSEGKPAPLVEYGANREGRPLIADDADVSVIAAHTARLALDLLMRPDASHYPNSVYAIGMGEGSVFTQPFHTYPIEVGSAISKPSKEILSKEEVAKEITTIVEIFVNQNETSNSSVSNRPPAA
jgi:molybdopterin/thiamine biosynthesis adenylyltransferase